MRDALRVFGSAARFEGLHVETQRRLEGLLLGVQHPDSEEGDVAVWRRGSLVEDGQHLPQALVGARHLPAHAPRTTELEKGPQKQVCVSLETGLRGDPAENLGRCVQLLLAVEHHPAHQHPRQLPEALFAEGRAEGLGRPRCHRSGLDQHREARRASASLEAVEGVLQQVLVVLVALREGEPAFGEPQGLAAGAGRQGGVRCVQRGPRGCRVQV